ncbi:hypothetical protein KP509_37G059900 [Ceratopteris richardii]|uniref:Cyanovirin-N domain-containing protein n=1 Tax=Ceratopteris richardii TaxID=49495 RepID=A0A8T2Q9J7_CERRI|nr:hypothetical protein KP509_37G059900 [Ceratopteris richardii]
MSKALSYVGFILVLFILKSSSILKAVQADCYGAFDETCLSVYLDPLSGLLTAVCLDDTDGLTQSSLNLNGHVANINGVLRCGPNGGNFLLSCVNVSYELPYARLRATCLDFKGDFAGRSSLNLSKCITNLHGFLHWACLPVRSKSSANVQKFRHLL